MTEEQREDDRRAEEQRRRCMAAIDGFLDELRYAIHIMADEHPIAGDAYELLTKEQLARLMVLGKYVMVYEVLPPERVHSLMREFGGFTDTHSDEANFEKIYDELKEVAK